MRILIALNHSPKARALALELESQREDWSCRWVTDGREALALAGRYQLLILDSVLKGLSGRAIIRSLQGRPAPPFVLLVGENSDLADGCLPRQGANYVAAIETVENGLPRLYDANRGGCVSQAFLTTLGMDARLKGFAYLAGMLAALLGNPALLGHMTDCLYPAAARQAGSTPAAVERCARHAIEALWSRGNLSTLERYFGQSVDPEKGKPTTREFLAMGVEHCLKDYDSWAAHSSADSLSITGEGKSLAAGEASS